MSVPNGRLTGRACAVGLGLTGTGKEQVAVQFNFTDHPGESLTWYGFFTEDAFDICLRALRACGWKGQSILDFQNGDLCGLDTNEVQLVVATEPDLEGTPRQRINFVNELGGLALKERLDDAQAKSFDARMRDRIKAYDLKKAGGSNTAVSDRPPV
ncbi:MAG TPA: hypothetical protein VFD92_04525 [Candidatus Binatia bacterium]|nr:hypothetical protein [Candidatus Binatia bacterium]